MIKGDDYLYGDNWSMKSYEEFRDNLFAAINKDGTPKIIASIYYNGADPVENRQIRVLNEMVVNKMVNQVYILILDKETQAARLIDRSFNRLLKKEDAGTCVETSASRGCLLAWSMTNYDKNVMALNLFARFMSSFQIKFQVNGV